MKRISGEIPLYNEYYLPQSYIHIYNIHIYNINHIYIYVHIYNPAIIFHKNPKQLRKEYFMHYPIHRRQFDSLKDFPSKGLFIDDFIFLGNQSNSKGTFKRM